MFYDVNVGLFPLALMYNKNPYSLGLEKEGFCLFPRLQKLQVKSVNVPCCRNGFPHPVFRNSIKFLINDLKCLLDEKRYYEYWGPLLLLNVILWWNNVLSQHNFNFSEVIHFLNTRGLNQNQFFVKSSPWELVEDPVSLPNWWYIYLG